MAATLDLGNLLVHLRANTTQFSFAMNRATATMKRVSAHMARMGTISAVAVTAIGAASVKAFGSFDDAMTKSLAIMSDITPQLRREMESLALTMSSKTVTSATDLAKSYFFLASAGFTAQQSMASLAAVNRFAIAGSFDMALATDLATDAQSALGLTVKNVQQNMVNMIRVTDVLTGANTLANATVQQFAEALTSQAGPMMRAYKIELEEGVAVLAAYADQGIKAQRAGNMFSRMIRLMTKGARDNAEAWEAFGLNIFDATGELKPMHKIIGDLSNVLGSFSTEQKGAALELLGFQARSQQAILPLLGLQDRIEEYNKKLLKMKGITKDVAEKVMKSFNAQMKIVWNNIRNIGIAIGERLAPAIRKIGMWIRENQKIIQFWAFLFMNRVLFVKDVLLNFLRFMKEDWRGGLKFAFDVTLELFVGLGKSIAVIMVSAAETASSAFIKTFGKRLGKWLIELGAPEGVLGILSMSLPPIMLGRLAVVKAGVELLDASAAPPRVPTNMKAGLRRVMEETKAGIKKIEAEFGTGVLGGAFQKLRKRDLDSYFEIWKKHLKDVSNIEKEMDKERKRSMADFSKVLEGLEAAGKTRAKPLESGFQIIKTALVSPQAFEGKTIPIQLSELITVAKQQLLELKKEKEPVLA